MPNVGVVLQDKQVVGVRRLNHLAKRIPARHPEHARAADDGPLHDRAQQGAAEERQGAAAVGALREHEVKHRQERAVGEWRADGEPLRAAEELGRRVRALPEHVVDDKHTAEERAVIAAAAHLGHHHRRAVGAAWEVLVEVEMQVRRAPDVAAGLSDDSCRHGEDEDTEEWEHCAVTGSHGRSGRTTEGRGKYNGLVSFICCLLNRSYA